MVKSGYPSPNYYGKNLKEKLLSHEISEQINISVINPGNKGCVRVSVVYRKSLTLHDTICSNFSELLVYNQCLMTNF